MQKIASVAIGASTGGIKALKQILPHLSKEGSPYAVIIAIHLGQKLITDLFVKRQNLVCPQNVVSAKHGETIKPGTIYIISGGFHGEVVKRDEDIIISLNEGPKVNHVRPSVDVLMNSVAEVYKENSVGVLLTGMGTDGAHGMKAIKDAGGTTIAQDERTSAVFAMPKSAIDLGCVDRVLPLQDIPDEILKQVEEKVR